MQRRYPRLVRIILTIGPSIALWALIIEGLQLFVRAVQGFIR
jgi:hypothetical protein